MRIRIAFARTTCGKAVAWNPGGAGARWLLSALLLWLLPAVAQAQFNYTLANGTITITGYTGPGGAVTIPSVIFVSPSLRPVTSIGDGAFSYCASVTSVMIPGTVLDIGSFAFDSCSGLTSVAIPGSVTSIGAWAFYGCTRLASIAIPNSVARIASDTFAGCTGLTSVTIGSGVTSIGDYAFDWCTSLANVTIPAGVTNIAGTAFLKCPGLTAINVAAQNPVYSSATGVLFNKSQTALVRCPGGRSGSFTVPADVTNIGNYAFFYCTNLTDVTVPASVTSLGQGAFGWCTHLISALFKGNAPLGGAVSFDGCGYATVYYLAGTTGWSFTYGGCRTALASPNIVTQPRSQAVAPGSSVAFSVTATGLPQISYLWRKNGAALAGATQSSYTIASARATDPGAYSVAISNTVGGVISANATLVLDGLKPTVTISTPTSGQRITNASPINITGKAADNIGISNVWCQLNGTGWRQATTGNGWTNWSVAVPPRGGTNTVMVYAEDRAGNRSLTVTRSFVHVTFSPLTLVINGQGTVSPANLNGSLLEVGRSYTATAGPGAGWLFRDWTGTLAGLPSSSVMLRFVMESNATLRATFVANPFNALKGSYYGLFAESHRAQESSGFLSLSLTAGGGYSGKLACGASGYPISGQFNAAGKTHRTISRVGKSPWVLDMEILFTDQVIVGTVSNGVNGGWVAGLGAERAVFDARANPATQFAGKYTLSIPGAEDISRPQGCGYVAITVDAGGNATLAGSLADSTNFTQTVPVLQSGQVPMYAPLYGGKGSVWSWVGFDGTRPSESLQGRLSWIRPPLNSRFYPAGFTNTEDIAGSRYTPPASATERVIAVTNGIVAFWGYDLIPEVVNQITLTADNRVINLSPNPLSLNLTLANGLFSGSVQIPGTTRTYTFKGALLQRNAAGYGYLLATNRSEIVYLGPRN